MPAAKPIELYKRHSQTCTVHDAVKRNLKIDPDYYFDCSCVFWVRGRLRFSGKLVDRQSTGTNDKTKAIAKLNSMIEADRAAANQQLAHGSTIAQFAERFMTFKVKKSGDSTCDGYRALFSCLKEFGTSRGIYYMSELDGPFLQDFIYAGIKVNKESSRGQYFNKLVVVLKFALREGCIKEMLWLKVEKPQYSFEVGDPFNNEDISRLIDGVLALKPTNLYGYRTKPKTAVLLIELMHRTGMRRSDAVLFNPAKAVFLAEPNLWCYSFVPQKSIRKNLVSVEMDVFLESSFLHEIKEADWMSEELPFAWGEGKRKKVLTFKQLGNYIYDVMQLVGESLDPPIEDCRPHRLRDRFAVDMLESGLTVAQVSKLLGHKSEAVTRKHYAKWTKKQSENLASDFALGLAELKRRSPDSGQRGHSCDTRVISTAGAAGIGG